jgi:hypothetical protein
MCTRVLGLASVFAFRDLLERWMTGDSKPLLDVLKKHTPSYVHRNIEGVLAEGKATVSSPTPEGRPSVKDKPRAYENFSVPIDPETAKKLTVLSVMESVSIPDWLQRVVADVVAAKYKIWLADQRQDNS